MIALGILLSAYLVPGIQISSFYVAMIVAVILGFLNAVVRPVLLILTLPINLLTLGLFIFVINGLIFWFVASFIDGFDISGLWSATLGAMVVSIISWFGNQLLKSSERNRSSHE